MNIPMKKARTAIDAMNAEIDNSFTGMVAGVVVVFVRVVTGVVCGVVSDVVAGCTSSTVISHDSKLPTITLK